MRKTPFSIRQNLWVVTGFTVLLASIFFNSMAASDTDKKKLFNEANGYYKVDEFKEALDLFLKYDAQYPSDNEAKYKIGLIYLQTGQFANGLKYFKQVNYPEFIKIEEGLDNYLGRAYHENNKFDSASIYYKKYLVTLQGHHSKAYNKLIHEIEERIEACKNGAEFKDRSLKVYITNLGKNINSKFDDYSPVISADEKVIYYTSKRVKSPDDEEEYLDEIFTSSKNDKGEWSPATIVKELNSKDFHDAPVALSHDGTEMILYRSISSKNGDLYHSILTNGKWSDPVKLPGHINSKYWEPSASFGEGGKVLYFSSDRPGGFGGSDIYISRKNADGTWGDPVNLGNVINTDHDEDSPFILADNQTLYFSSKAHKNIGGYDVFRSVYDANTKTWSNPENLGYPVNTPDDDIYFVWSDDGSRAYFASNRTENNFGLKDIYLMDLQQAPYDIRVYDENKNIIPTAYVELTNATSGENLGKFTENANQDRISFYLSPGVKYTYTVKAPGYDSLADVFTINKKTDLYQYYSKDYTLKLIPKPEPVVAKVEEVVTTTPTVAATEVKKVEEVKAAPVEEKKVVEAKKELVAKAETEKKEVKKSVEKFLPETVYFDYNSSAIAEGEKAKLDKLVLYLKSVSAISVTVKGYTDNVGGDSFNKNLSLNRAKSAADYLKQQGISEGQISVKSYGLNKPVDSNKTDEGRSHNRRVEIELGTK